MKALIAREVSRRELDQHLKLGRGGIREIEFIVQSMQLVRGGSDRRLQNASLLEVLPLLAGSKLMSAADIAELTDAYLVLRKAENAVQMIRDEQTHSLPTEAIDQARVAVNMGAADWDALHALIDAARDRVARQFEALLCGYAQTRSRVTPNRARTGWRRTMRKSTRSSSAAAFRRAKSRTSRRPWRPTGNGGVLSAAG